MIARTFAEFVAGTEYTKLPEEAVAAAKRCILDWVGCAVVGSLFPQARKLEAALGDGGGGSAAFLGLGRRGNPSMAALYNGVSCHTVQLDDLHRRTILHPAAAVIPAAWAAAEKKGAGGQELIAAVIAGYEVAIRTAEAVTPSHLELWYPTGTCGAFGAAAAASRVLGLEPEQVVYALGNAGTVAGGLWEYQRTKAMGKQLLVGKAAFNGLTAALLAQQDFTGADTIYEGDCGFLRAFSRQPRLAMLAKRLGEEFRINEITCKLYPSGRHTHGGIDLALRLRDRGVRAQDVELMRIKTYRDALRHTGNPSPATSEEARFSLPFCVAVTFLHGRPTLDSFGEEMIADQQIRRLMVHTNVEVDQELELLYPNYWPVTMEIIDRSSHIIREHTDYPKGDPENPASPQEIEQKFLELVSRVYAGGKAEELLSALLKLEQVDEIRSIIP